MRQLERVSRQSVSEGQACFVVDAEQAWRHRPPGIDALSVNVYQLQLLETAAHSRTGPFTDCCGKDTL